MSPKQDPKSAVIQKALTDPAFKAELLKNPAAAVEKATGVKVPDGITVKIVEDSAAVVHLVLPPAASKGALSESDLGKVSGGAGNSSAFGPWGSCGNSSSCGP